MNNNINKLIREELIKKRKNNLVESLSPLNDIDDRDFFFHSYIQKSANLLDEGYSIEEIEQIAENMFTDKILQGGGGVAKDIWGSTNILDALFGGGLGMIKEQVIRWVLVNLGVGKGLGNVLDEVITQSNIGEKVGEKLCAAIWKR